MKMKQTLAIAVLGATAYLFSALSPADEFVDNAKVTPLMSQALTGMPGKVGTMITVEYPPGGTTDKHRHPGAHTFVYVLEGTIEMQVEGKDAVTLGAGQTYYETPDDVHVVSRNTSDSKPARFLVVFVQDQGQPPLEPVH